MNKTILLVLITLYFNNTHAAQHGRLFTIDSSWENEPRSFNICLYDNGAVDCENFMVYGREIYIQTRQPVKSNYALNGGIRFMIEEPKYGCTMMNNFYCAFKVTHDKWSYIKIL